MFRVLAASVCGAAAYCLDNPNVHILNHPFKQILLSDIRDRNSDSIKFARSANRLLRLLIEETLGREPQKVESRLTPTNGEY